MRRVVLVALLLLVPARALAGRSEDLKQANADYAAQRYQQAAAAWERAVADGLHHEAVYYDIGNAYFRAGQLGKAILWYERALRLDPGFEDARYNLDVAREVVSGRMGKDQVKGATADPFWITAVHWLPLELLLLLVLGLDALFFGLLIGLRFLPTGFVRTGVLVGACFSFAAGALAGTLLGGRLYYLSDVKMSVVVADEVVMLELPDPQSREMPKLHAGHRVIVLRDARGADGKMYRRIRLANHVEGWVPLEAVEPI